MRTWTLVVQRSSNRTHYNAHASNWVRTKTLNCASEKTLRCRKESFCVVLLTRSYRVKEARCCALSRSSLHARHHSHLAGAAHDVAEPRLVVVGDIIEEVGASLQQVALQFRSPTRLIEFHLLVEEIPYQGRREKWNPLEERRRVWKAKGGKKWNLMVSPIL